jgi:hypothetical protein
MLTGRNPDHMSAGERRDEIAGILAAGLLRAVRRARRSGSANSCASIGTRPSRRDLRAKTPLSVAPQPPPTRATRPPVPSSSASTRVARSG